MNKRLKFPILLLLFLFVNELSLLAQSNREIPSRSATSFQVLEQNFTQGQLSKTNLAAFELRATQKIKDFADYVLLINDPNLNDNFKKRSVAAVLKLFVNDSVSIHQIDWNDEENSLDKTNLKRTSIKHFLKKLQNTSNEKTNWSFQNFLNTTSPQWTDNRYYQWQTTCELTQTNEQKSVTKKVSFNIYLKKIEKKFGANSKMIWEVFLGDME